MTHDADAPAANQSVAPPLRRLWPSMRDTSMLGSAMEMMARSLERSPAGCQGWCCLDGTPKE